MVANSPPVSLIPVVHLDLQVSPRIFEKICDDSNAIIRGLGEDDSGKKTRSNKSRDTVPLSLLYFTSHLEHFLHVLGGNEARNDAHKSSSCLRFDEGFEIAEPVLH